MAKGAAAFQAQVNGVVSQVVGGVQAFTDPLSSLARPPANLATNDLGARRDVYVLEALMLVGVAQEQVKNSSTTADEESVVEGCLNGQAQGWRIGEQQC